MRVLSAHKKAINCVAFSPDGRLLAEAAHGGTVRVWDVAAGTVTQTFAVRGVYPNRMRLAFSPDGRRLAVVNSGVVLVDLAGGARLRFRGASFVSDLAFSPDGRQLVGTSNTYTRWDLGTAKALPRLNVPPAAGGQVVHRYTACAFRRDGARLALARVLGFQTARGWRAVWQLVLYDLAADAVAARIEWPGTDAHMITFSPDGQLVAAACGPVLRVWDATAGTPLVEKPLDKPPLTALAFSPDGRYAATANKSHAMRLWDAGVWGEPKAFEWDVGKTLGVAFAPDGATAAASGDTGQIVLFDVD